MDFQSAPVVARHDEDGGFTLVFDGPIHTNVAWLEREFAKVIAAQPKQVRLDLTNTEYMSSTGIGALVGLRNKVKAYGGVVQVVAVQKRILGLFKIAFLDKLFQIAPDAVEVAEGGKKSPP